MGVVDLKSEKNSKTAGTRIVKERVGVDTLFWRRYFVTYGV